MGDHSAIEWTDATWNFVDGCDQISPGCAHCYAKTFAARGLGNFAGGRRFEDVRAHDDKLELPLRWKRPRMVFVVSMGDPFHEDVPDSVLDRAHAVMALADHHTFQVLTKRDERMLAYYTAPDLRARIAYRLAESFVNRGVITVQRGAEVAHSLTDRKRWPLPNVWVGVSVENQRFADARIPRLLATPAAVRWISAEPLLDELDLTPFVTGDALAAPGPGGFRQGPALDWVVVGGESGAGARPFALSWARSIVQQCKAAGVPVFVKQIGSNAFGVYVKNKDGVFIGGAEYPYRDRKGGDPTEWPEDLRVREYPRAMVRA